MKETKRYNKYFNSNTPEKLVERRSRSKQIIMLARTGDACDRMIALQRFQKECAERKRQRLLEEVRNVELLFSQ
ncbi:hypothetical protein Megvenef_01374 [Candidatus Megaera venefica]|uniref:Uncharacterized protein n=1 Tax=Candidatus Megaera venefica TaxID=2055910 RepID=A0ABU5NE26_9RICK|nr:hypothetical protein [Candidatus Megaera venefica]MEA0971396.1 hypothetical protein [Candidatus Megaera venefica]